MGSGSAFIEPFARSPGITSPYRLLSGQSALSATVSWAEGVLVTSRALDAGEFVLGSVGAIGRKVSLLSVLSLEGSETEVGPPVVGPVSVLVVNDQVFGVFASHPHPNQPVGSKDAFANTDPQISSWLMEGGCNISLPVVPSSDFVHPSGDNPSLWVVIKQKFQRCLRRQRQCFFHTSLRSLKLFRESSRPSLCPKSDLRTEVFI